MTDHKIDVTTSYFYTDEDLFDIVVSALEGGIGYWACLDNTTPDWDAQPEDMPTSEWAWKLLQEGRELRFLDAEEEDGPWTFGMREFFDGIGEAIRHGDWDGSMDSMDADAADCIFQRGMLGNIVYG